MKSTRFVFVIFFCIFINFICAFSCMSDDQSSIDQVIIINPKATLKKEPGSKSPNIMKLTKKDFIVLIDREPVNVAYVAVYSKSTSVFDTTSKEEIKFGETKVGDGKWYNVIHVKSGAEGWVQERDINIRYGLERKQTKLFEAERDTTLYLPEIVINNDSYSDLRLKIGEKNYNINPKSQIRITINSGTYKYHASAPAVIPSFGEQTFNSGYRYNWKFWIVKSYGYLKDGDQTKKRSRRK